MASIRPKSKLRPDSCTPVLLPGNFQYTSGKSTVVYDLSHSVMIRVRSPLDGFQAESSRAPSLRACSFARVSCVQVAPIAPMMMNHQLPQFEFAWPDSIYPLSVFIAPGVTRVRPKSNLRNVRVAIAFVQTSCVTLPVWLAKRSRFRSGLDSNPALRL